MSSNVPNVRNEFVRALTDALLECVVTNTGDYLRPAPFAFVDSHNNPIIPNGSEVRISLKTNPEGTGCSVTIANVNTNGAQNVTGQLDLDKLTTLISFE
jgi:hypothetical protein